MCVRCCALQRVSTWRECVFSVNNSPIHRNIHSTSFGFESIIIIALYLNESVLCICCITAL